MNTPRKTKVPSHFALTAALSCGITITLSLGCIIVSILELLFRYNCSAGSLATATGSDFFWNTIYRTYIQADDCRDSLSVDNITSEYTVFVFAIITLCISVICLVTAVALITATQDEQFTRCMNINVFAYIGSCSISLVVDITAATHFGLDYTYLGTELAKQSPGAVTNYKVEVLRQGAFILMGIAMKGYIAHAINMVLLILLTVYLVQYQNMVKNEEHSIHKLGALNAFEQQRQQGENWLQPEMYSQSPVRAHQNNNFSPVVEPPRTSVRTPVRETSSYHPSNSRPYDRQETWQSQSHMNHGSRPFSYLEDIKRPVPTRPPSSPANDTAWNREAWSSPPVPAPDYSPTATRQLKSALKPAYM